MSPDDNNAPSRRQFLKGIGLLGALAAGGTAIGVGVWGSPSQDSSGAPGRRAGSGSTGGQAPASLDTLANNVVPGGPGKDGIPAIDHPRFLPAADAGFLSDDEPVFGLEYHGEVRAYPQIILVWHEIVNDEFAGERLSVTYCPLTGSTVGFRGQAGGRPLTFGTTGNLVNSNLLMYDRETDSEWPQLLGRSIRGQLKGDRLDELPLVWASWGAWREAHPDTVVLSTNTGYARSYGTDPYGSYSPLAGYYESGGPIFPVLADSDRFHPKDVVIGVKVGDARAAIPKPRVQDSGSVDFSLAGTRLRAAWDEALGTARVSDRAGSSNPFFLDVMWFAWYAFYPDTEVVA